jgi:hypothetical protein
MGHFILLFSITPAGIQWAAVDFLPSAFLWMLCPNICLTLPGMLAVTIWKVKMRLLILSLRALWIDPINSRQRTASLA